MDHDGRIFARTGAARGGGQADDGRDDENNARIGLTAARSGIGSLVRS